MADQIINKLNEHILNGVTREADVIYLLVQIRKILDREKLKTEYPFLDLYCDWVLHTDISSKKNQQILGKINLAVAALEDPDGMDYADALDNLNKAISLDGLYGDMQKIFQAKKIDESIFGRENWQKFGELLFEILRDIPLIASGKQLLSEFSIAEAVDISHSFRIRIKLPDDRIYSAPMASVVGSIWGMGVSAVGPSGPPPPEQDRKNHK